MEGFNISTFLSENKYGFLKPSYFLARINPPSSVGNSASTKQFLFLVSTAGLPGVQILTQEYKIYGQGPTVKMPYDVGVTDMTMKIYCDGNGNTIEYFYNWFKSVVNLDAEGKSFRGAYSNQVSYRRDYATSIDLIVFSDIGQPVIECTLQDAFPVAVSETALDWGNTGEVLAINVTWSFRAFKIKRNNQPQYSPLRTGSPGAPTDSPIASAFETAADSIAAQIRENAMSMSPPASSSVMGIASTLGGAFASAFSLFSGSTIVGGITSTINSLSNINSTLSAIDSQISGAVASIKSFI